MFSPLHTIQWISHLPRSPLGQLKRRKSMLWASLYLKVEVRNTWPLYWYLVCNLLAWENAESLFYPYVLALLIHCHVSLMKCPQVTKSESVSKSNNGTEKKRLVLLDKDCLVNRGLVYFSPFLIFKMRKLGPTQEEWPPKDKEPWNVSILHPHRNDNIEVFIQNQLGIYS